MDLGLQVWSLGLLLMMQGFRDSDRMEALGSRIGFRISGLGFLGLVKVEDP